MEQIRCVIVANVLTPYRVDFHQRLSLLIPNLALRTLVTYRTPPLPWDMDMGSLEVEEYIVGDRPDRFPKIIPQLRALANILRDLRQNHADVVVVNGYNDLVRLGLILVLPALRMPVVMAADSNYVCEAGKPAWKRAIKRPLLGVLRHRLSAILTMGDAGVRYFQMYMRKPPPIFIVPYTVDEGRFGGRRQYTLAAVCNHFGFRSDRQRLLFVGRLSPEKGIQYLLQAFDDIASYRPDWDLVIAGHGSLENEVRRLVQEQKGDDRVHILGFVDHDELPRLYAACDALVLPSLREPWGIVVTEALASGLPVVATSVSGAAVELLGDPTAPGFLIPPGDTGALTDALLLITEPTNLQRLSATTVERYEIWRSRADPFVGFREAIEFVLKEKAVAS